MKNYITYFKYIILSVVLISVSCTEEPEPYAIDAAPGFGITFTPENEFIAFTKNPDETITGDVDVSGEFFVTTSGLYDRVILIKSLLNSANEELESVLQERDLPFNESISFSISSAEELFEGFETNINDLTVGSKFQLVPYGITPEADTIAVQTPITLDADYIAFCEIPNLELGTWIVTNTSTLFSKEVELFWDEVWGQYVFTDFGIDWSNWNDFWYGTMFTLTCPLVDGDPVEVNLSGIGIDTTDEFVMLDDAGVSDTRNLRRMPYIYKEDSPKGYYDSDTGEIVFKDVSVTDAWWGLDQHTFSMTFKKK